MTGRSGWIWFSLWAVPGLVLGLQVSQIGAVFLPIGLIAAVLVAQRSRVWPEILGLAAGIGLMCLFVALLNGDSWPWNCPASGEIITRTPNSVSAESCDRWYALPWLIVGLIFSGGSALAYRLIARHSRPLGRETTAAG